MAEDFENWITHDGARPEIEVPAKIRVAYVSADLDEGLITAVSNITPNWPGFYWRWQRVRISWYRSMLRRVCDDPAYAPIAKYVVLRRRSAAAEQLAAISADPYTPPPVVGPEGPVRQPERVPG
jgi:hypothetical protein